MKEAAHPDDPSWQHEYADLSTGVRVHYVRRGQGPTALLLHGWPGTWYDWRHAIPLLEGSYDLVVPDFKCFGRSEKPIGRDISEYGPEGHAEDMFALIESLGLERPLVVGHDIGASVAQTMSRTRPEALRGLVLFNPAFAGIGPRRFEPAIIPDFWYQHFHNLPWSHHLVGYNRDTVRLYLKHFYDHWVGRKASVLSSEFEAIVDAYAEPGAFEASIAYYRARAGNRIREASTSAQDVVVRSPAVIYWGELDPVIRSAWSDRLAEFFSDLKTFKLLEGVGHFVPFEAPEAVVEAINAFEQSVG